MTKELQNAGDAESVKKAKDKAKFRRDTELSELRAILNTDGGRKFFWRLLEQCGVYSTSFTGNSTTFFNEGKRQVGLFVLAEIVEADADAYTRMLKENRKKETD